ncbi:MAG TPA: ATP-binding protein, partial [Verrucomicrobiae bacterium]
IGMDLHEGHPAYDSLKQIYEASSRGRDLLHKVRTFAQRPPIALQTLQLSSLIEETAQILRGIIPDKLELKVRVEPHFPVLADPVQIQQLVMDLCLHCWQNLHERRGTIQILLQNHRLAEPIGLLAAGEVVRLTVQDDSPGLDAAALRKVFHPFQTRKASSKKIGLELFMAKETALAHRGDLIAVSQPGQGLAFHLYLPVAATA